MRVQQSLLASALTASTFAASINYNAPAIASTALGNVEGLTLSSKVKAFLGIPFAVSPPERFGAPVDPKPWTDTLKAKAVKPACVQQFGGPENIRNFTISIFSSPMPEESEDCLYLNVWVPAAPPPEGGYPVMFWLYGGNLQFGTSGLPMYSGEHIAANRGVIVVGTNYRTNVFGFPNSPDLPKGEANPGFLDQRKALSWVSSHIKSFGGDPAKVTLFGESAGGYSVKQLIALPPSPLPFRAAIMQSEAAGLNGGAESWATLSKSLNCTSLACVRKAPASAIKNIIEKGNMQFDPVKDDITASKNISLALTSGTAAKVPFIIGSNADDGTAFAIVFGMGIDASSPAFVATSKSLTDLTFQCPASLIATTAASAKYEPVYRYFFNASFSQYSPFTGAGAYHSAEIEPIFGTFDPKRTELKRLGDSLQSKWTEFAKNPKKSLEGWPKVEGTKQPVMVFGTTEDKIVDSAVVDGSCAGMAADIALQGL